MIEKIRAYLDGEGFVARRLGEIFEEIAAHASPQFASELKQFLDNLRTEQINDGSFYQRMSQVVNGLALYDHMKTHAREHAEKHLEFLWDGGFIEPGSRVLDVGCGTGLESAFFGQAVGPEGRVIGLDLSMPLLKVARERANRYKLSNTHFIQGNRDTLGFLDDSFDSLVCIHSLTEGESYNGPQGDIYYTYTVKKRIGGFRRHLRTGGRIFVSLPLTHSLQEAIDYESERIHDVVCSAGFEDVERGYIPLSDEGKIKVGSLVLWGEKKN